MEAGAYVLEEFTFHGSEFEVIHHLAVCPFTGVAAQHHHSHVIGLGLIGDGGFGDGHLGEFAAVEPAEVGTAEGTLGLVVCLEGGVIIYQGLVHGEAGILHAFYHIDHVGLVHIAGTGAAGHEINGRNAVEGHFLITGKRQGAFVAKEHHGFTGSLAGHGGVGLQVRLVGELIALEMRSAHNVSEHVAYIAVQFFLGDGSILYSGDYTVNLVLVAGFHEVILGFGALDGAGLVAPVRHHDALEAPFVTENRGEEAFALLGVLSVELVVGAHHRPGIGFLHGNLKVLEINLAEGTLGDDSVVLVAVGFLVVGSIVLDGSTHAIALDTLHISGGHLAGQERVFGEILEVTAVQGVAVNVHTGGQEHVHAIFQHFITHGLGNFFHQGKVPGTGQQGSHRETGAIIGIAVSLAGGLDAQAGRAVGQNGPGDAQALNGTGVARCTGNLPGRTGSYSVHHSGTGATHQQGGFLLKGHGLQDFFDVVFTQLRLGAGHQGHTQGCKNQKDFFHISVVCLWVFDRDKVRTSPVQKFINFVQKPFFFFNFTNYRRIFVRINRL